MIYLRCRRNPCEMAGVAENLLSYLGEPVCPKHSTRAIIADGPRV